MNERNLDPDLIRLRIKERKKDFEQQIQNLQIKDLLPKSVIQSKLGTLHTHQHLLGHKDGYQKMENLLGLKLIIDASMKFPAAATFIAEISVEVPEEQKNKTLEEKRKELAQRENEQK